MRVIGLTGGIASGKSTVARLFAEQGVPVIDADQLAREAVAPGSVALRQIAEYFGRQVLRPDGTLDRDALAGVVFVEPAARKKLEGIVHPVIRDMAEQRLAELRDRGEPVAIYMAPLLIEAGVTDRVDEIWVVYVDRETQMQRLIARDGISAEAAGQRLAAQMPLAEKRRHGRVVIDNNGSLEELRVRVLELCRRELQKEGATTVAP
jgi:dephospho-CoA kinase